MKRIAISLGILFMSYLASALPTYANVDQTRITEFRYECRANGEGILFLSFNLSGHHTYSRQYRIDNPGFIEVKDGNYTSIDRNWNLYIPGCGCPSALTGATRFASYSGTNIAWGNVGNDYGQTTSSGWDDTWVYLNGPISRTTTVVTLHPKNDGIPQICFACREPENRACELSAPQKQFYTTASGINFPLQSNYDPVLLKCKNPPTPTITCDKGPASIMIAVTDPYVGFTGSLANIFQVSIPSSVSSQSGTCTILYPQTSCTREKREIITITPRPASCINNIPDCTLMLSGSRTYETTTSGVVVPFSWSPRLGTTACQNTMSGPLLPVEVWSYSPTGPNIQMISGVPSVSCTQGSGAIVRLSVSDAIPPGQSPLDPRVTKAYSVYFPPAITTQSGVCTITTPDSMCSPGKQERITFVNRSVPVCSDPAKSPCRLYSPQTEFYISTGSIRFDLSSNYNSGSLPCTNPGIPTISCQNGTGAMVEPWVGTNTARFSIHIPTNISSKTGSCSITYPADSCNSERVETIRIIEKDPICLNPSTPQGCQYILEKNQVGPENIKDMTSAYAMIRFTELMLPIRINTVSTGAVCEHKQPLISCSVAGRAEILATNDMMVPNAPYNPGYVLFINRSILSNPGTCTVTYPATRCGPERKEILNIISTGANNCAVPTCDLSLEKNLVSLSSSDISVRILSNYGSPTLGANGLGKYRCKNPPVITDVSCTTGTGARIMVASKMPPVGGSIDPLDYQDSYTLSIPSSIASQEGSCTVQYGATECSPARSQTVYIREKPETITGVVITPTQICFNIIGKSGRIISGFPLNIGDLDLTLGSTTSYIDGVSTPEYSFNDISIQGTQYCISYTININNTIIDNITNNINNYTNITNYYSTNLNTFNSSYTLPQNLGIYPAPGITPIKINFCSMINGAKSCMFTTPGGFVMTNQKRCTAQLEVERDGQWTKDGVMYDESQKYRIVTYPSWCSRIGSISFSAGPFATGGTFSGNVSPLEKDNNGFYSFTAAIQKRSGQDTPRTSRGLSVGLWYDIAGYRYHLTERADDWDGKLSILGNGMRGVRVIGSTVGMGSGVYNLNNSTIIQDQNAFSVIQNRITRNVADLTRNVSPGVLSNGVVYYNGNMNYTGINATARTVIIKGGNLTIDKNIDNNFLQGIIVLKDASGNGGNVIIANNANVNRLNTVIFAEGILQGAGNKDQKNINTQLVLKGALYSRNTIGGYDATPQYIYPNISTAVANDAFIQDLNYIRSYPISDTNPYLNMRDPFIIHYDPSVISNPPPGF